MTLTTRLAIAMILLVAIALSAVGWLSYRDLEKGLLPRVLDRLETHSRLVATDLESVARSAPGDIIIFRDLAAVVGLMRARLNGGMDPVDATSETVWRERLANRLSAQLAVKPAFARMRFISVEDGGREIARIDRSGPNGAFRAVTDSELRRMGDTAWFRESIKLTQNEIHVSRIELNTENGTIAEPEVPVLRVATPIFSSGKVYGIVVIDIDMGPALERVRKSPRTGETAYAVDAEGGYLVHPDRSREFGWQKGVTADWSRDWPDLAQQRGNGRGVARMVPDRNGNPEGVTFAPVVLAGSQWVAVIELAPNAAFMAPAAAIRNSSILVGLIAVLLAAALAPLIARSLIGPIVTLTAAVEHAAESGASAIPVDARGETGVLARAFARVIGEANAKTLALEREVAEHRRTEAARDHHAERERLFSAAVESSNDPIITMSMDGTITGWNSAAERLYGYAAREAVGRKIDLIVPADRQSEVEDTLRRISWGEKIEHNETIRRRKDGSLVEVSLSISPIKAPSGATIGISKVARDITETNRTRLALRQQTEERRRIFETSQDLILVMNARGFLVQISPSCETILGYRPDEMIGRSGEDFIHPDDLEISRAEMRAARRGERTKISDTRVFHKDGRAVPLSWLGTWSEPVKRFFFVGRDMTETLRAQQTLRESEQLARGIIETALDAFVQMDESGCITDWNSQAEKIFGWSRSDAIGRKLVEMIVPEQHRAAHLAGLEHFLFSGEGRILGRRLEIEALRRDGREIKVELSITELKRRNGIVFNGFIRDLTEKLAAEDRIRHAEKMEAVGQLTGGIAHDFNNILTVITGTIEILAEAVADRPQLAAITRMIDDAASRGAELTQHLLAFARKQPLQPREVDVNTLIIDTAKLLRPTLGEQIEIESVFEGDVCVATVDPNQLATALLNLALNARDAMPNGGKLILETGFAVLDENYASNNEDVRPGRYVLIAVSDTGIGIPSEILDRVFDPFFTSKGPGKGTGLGLSMVYGFVKQSAGHIKIYSEEGHGTTIKMYLPPGTGAAVAAEPHVPAVQGGHETILVVEDDKLVRDYVLTQLHSLGYVTLDAANAAEALALVEAGRHFDLLFTDIIMPGAMNGRQLADEIERRRPGAKVLYTSGYTENAIIHHGRLDTGVLLLAKPYRKSDLAGMVRKALGD
ncbi:PAS domain S-box protein [Bradyrhizobium sp.]|uniref:PAS domain S-box protein n=1 Tax=Bradyrhizobium sp. TaxID=376 RepID=UPI001D9A2318|nr:PAS domain S-box protein [Bradyrhizobium sp.]MBI5322586.1 PAS domain S-box protein [Bradyrhizobium sp.]